LTSNDYQAQRHVQDYFQVTGGGDSSSKVWNEASEAMKRQPSNWVDGEKRLKEQLKKLVELQKQGKDLGVPVLTRYLGDDIKAWVSEGDDKKAWEKKRDERYIKMRAQEEQWRMQVQKHLQVYGNQVYDKATTTTTTS